MRPIALQTLTWATVAAAVASALWLAAAESDPGATLRLTALPPALLPLTRPNEPAPTAAVRRRNHDPAAQQRQPGR